MNQKVQSFFIKKARREQIVMLTCYDFPTAEAEDAAGVDIIFVGDSVGTNMLGYDSVTQVTMEDMLHHVRAVRRGVKQAFFLVDMPYKSFESPEAAVKNAQLFIESGADGVKLEGGAEVIDIVKALRSKNVEVCGHVGFTPQTAGPRGKIVGKTIEEANRLIADAKSLADAGVFMIVLELVPEELSQLITANVPCPIIGIGSGRNLNGEVQVVNDILGITKRNFRHTKRFENWGEKIETAIKNYVAEVRGNKFPEGCNVTHLPAEIIDAVKKKVF